MEAPLRRIGHGGRGTRHARERETRMRRIGSALRRIGNGLTRVVVVVAVVVVVLGLPPRTSSDQRLLKA